MLFFSPEHSHTISPQISLSIFSKALLPVNKSRAIMFNPCPDVVRAVAAGGVEYGCILSRHGESPHQVVHGAAIDSASHLPAPRYVVLSSQVHSAPA